MKEIKKYTSIVRHGKSNTHLVYNVGDKISITEKIDGANASFCIDEENLLGVSCYSRNQILSEENRLRGFYDWVESNIVPIKEKLNPNYRYIGEWLVPHKVVYKEEYYNNFYLFSIWSDTEEKYLSDETVKGEAARLNLLTPRYFYEGEYISFEHLKQFVGLSDMTKEPNTGEGIVVKNVDYFDKYGRQIFTKIVSDKFAEVMKQKPAKSTDVKDDKLRNLVLSVLTEARVEKIILKLVDKGIINRDFGIDDIGTILKNSGAEIIEDIYKEEGELFKDIDDKLVRKQIGKIYAPMVRKIVQNNLQ